MTFGEEAPRKSKTSKDDSKKKKGDSNYVTFVERPDYSDDEDYPDVDWRSAEPIKPKQKGGTLTQTGMLYNKFRKIKDRYRHNLIEKHKEDDKKLQIEAMKKDGMELKGFSSFDKQEKEIEYLKFKNAEYAVN